MSKTEKTEISDLRRYMEQSLACLLYTSDAADE